MFGGCIDLAHVREVVRTVLSGIPRHSSVVEFLDPLGWVREPSPTRDGEHRELAILNVPFGGSGECVDVPDEMGFKKLDRLFTVIQLLFVVCFLGGEVLAVVMGASLGGDDEPVDNRSVGVGGEVVAGDGGADRLGRHLSKGEEVVLGGSGSCGNWSM